MHDLNTVTAVCLCLTSFPIFAAGTLVNWAVRMQRGSYCLLATLEAPISSEKVKPQRVKKKKNRHTDTHRPVSVCVYAMTDLLLRSKKCSQLPDGVITSRTHGVFSKLSYFPKDFCSKSVV